MSRSRLAATAAIVGALAVAGCSTPAPVTGASGASTSTAPSASAGTPSPSGTYTPLPNPVRTPVAKVKRQGGPAKPTVVAPPVSFDKPATYSDGVVLDIVKVGKGVETSQGPGAFPGREFVRLDLSLRNGSDKPIDLSSVVLTAFYGKANQKAEPVYAPEAGAADFSGAVAAGATATASYAFAIPASARGRVTLVVDFDALHSSALYTGSVVVR